MLVWYDGVLPSGDLMNKLRHCCLLALLVAVVAGCSSGSDGDSCVSGRSCAPATSDPCKVFATRCEGGVETCAAAENAAEGTSCGASATCRAGVCTPAAANTCVAGQSCTPASPDACKTYVTSCAGNDATCAPAANKPDGTACGQGQSCQAGSCAPVAGQGTIGTAGGTVAATDGTRIDVPQGALDESTVISIAASAGAPPAGALTPLYEFGPSGAVFAVPVTVTIPLPQGVTSATIYWSRLDGSGFDPIGGTVDAVARTISAQTPHFSGGYAGPATDTRVVTGVAQTTYLSATSRITVPDDLSAAPPVALVANGSGGFTTLTGTVGTGPAAGTFTIPGVPAGEYMLRVGERYVVTSTSSPDVGRLAGGRPPFELTPLTAPAGIDLTVLNLEPVADGHSLEFACSQADTWDFVTERFAAPPLAPGDISATLDIQLDPGDMTYGYAVNLIEGSKGHRALIAQLVPVTSATGVGYLRMARIAELPSFDLVEGASVPVTATMSTVAATKSVAFDWRGAAWAEALAIDGNPSSVCTSATCSAGVAILSLPGTDEDADYATSLDPLSFMDPVVSGSNFQTGTLTYGSPAQLGGWNEVARVYRSTRVLRRLPDTTAGGRFADGLWWNASPGVVAAGPIVPPVTPARAVTIAGKSFFDPDDAMGATPTVSWTPPATGPAIFYTLAVYRLTANGTATESAVVATFTTPHTTFTIPPGILTAGVPYVFTLRAHGATSAEAADRLRAIPFRTGLDTASAVIVSGIRRP